MRYGRSESLTHTAAEAFSFVDCIYVSMRTECGIRQVAVYKMKTVKVVAAVIEHEGKVYATNVDMENLKADGSFRW